MKGDRKVGIRAKSLIGDRLVVHIVAIRATCGSQKAKRHFKSFKNLAIGGLFIRNTGDKALEVSELRQYSIYSEVLQKTATF